MPISRHYKGSGAKVARTMRKRYGKDWKRVFYATEKKMGISNPGELTETITEELDHEEKALVGLLVLTSLAEAVTEDDDVPDEIMEKIEKAEDLLDEVNDFFREGAESDEEEDEEEDEQ